MVPVPVTVRPPSVPVPSRMMPALALEVVVVMLWKVRPLAAMVAPATFSAVPVLEVMVLPVPVALTVPPVAL